LQLEAKQVLEMRERTGLGLHECKRILRKEILLEMLDRATTVEELKAIVKAIILQAR
jgi:translation elongation factor EF-Ts